jgi:hypothetical protein
MWKHSLDRVSSEAINVIDDHGNGGSERVRAHHSHQPYWKRAHHDWRFWVGLVVMLGAMTIYVVSDDLALLPRNPPASDAVGK